MNTQKKKEEKRAAILKAASEVFKDRRYDEVKLDEVAKRAGVGKGTLYLYFKNKEDLFAGLAGEGIPEMAERVREIAAMDMPYRERLDLFCYEFSFFAHERHAWRRVLMQVSSASLEKKMHPQHQQVKESIFFFLQQGIDEGALRPDASTAVLECMLIGALFFRAHQIHRAETAVELEALVQCFWDAAKSK